MAKNYTCFSCNKHITDAMLGKRVRCPYCSSKILFKTRTGVTRVKAV